MTPTRSTAHPKAKRPAPKAKAAPHQPAAHTTGSAPKVATHLAPKRAKFHEAVGRRKSAIARVRWFPEGEAGIAINGKPLAAAFPWFEYQAEILRPLVLANRSTASISAKVVGGGQRGQVDAIRLGIARVLLIVDPELRTTLKADGLLKRDPRVKERKKYGLKRARRAPQWQKR